MMGWDSAGWAVGNWIAMGMTMVIFWGAVIAVIVWLIRRSRVSPRAGDAAMPVDRADRELAERFARGEIDEAQFTRTRSVLHSKDRAP